MFLYLHQWFSTFLSWQTSFAADKAAADPPKFLDATKLVGNAAIATYYHADYYDYSYTHNLTLHTGVCLMQKSGVK